MPAELTRFEPAAATWATGNAAASPEEAARQLARERFAEADRILRQIDDGWAPPPVDPVLVAQALGFRCEPVDQPGLEDAMITMASGTPTILFRRGRPGARTRYSIFHEIAHTLFPDFRNGPLSRGSNARHLGHQGLLEFLCDVAAAEFVMPVELFRRDLARAGFGLSAVDELSRRYGVSQEAVCRRMVESNLHSCALALVERAPNSPQRSRRLRSKAPGGTEGGQRVRMKVVSTTYSASFAARKLFIPTFPGLEKRSCLLRAARSGKPACGAEAVDLGGGRSTLFDIEALPLIQRPRLKGCSPVLAFFYPS